MINSIDELEKFDKQSLQRVLKKLSIEEVATAMHGVSPLLNKNIKKSMSLGNRIRLGLSPIKGTSVKLSKVEEIHKKITDIANEIDR